MEFKQKLDKIAKNNNIIMSQLQLTQFEQYYEYLVEKNKVMNLTAITDEDGVIYKHFIDSLSCCRVVNLQEIQNVIDVGTGAGFPGIPLKIMFPDVEFVLIDSLNKRITFLKEVIDLLGLEKIKVCHGRAEDLARDDQYRGRFDLCVSRAVANLNTLSEYCIPFLKKNGCFVSYKAGKGIEELQHTDHCMLCLGSKVEQVDQFSIDADDAVRVLIKIRKKKDTSKKYPRKAGVPSRNPL